MSDVKTQLMWSSTCQDSKRGGLVSPPKRSNSENGHSIANFVTPLLHKKENCEHSFFSRVRRVKSLWHMFYFPMEPSQSSPRSLYPIEKVQSAEEKGNIGKGQYERDRLRHFSAEGIESVSKLGSRGHVFHEQQIQDMQVLGVDISSWSKVQRYVFLILTLFAIMLLYGYMQEYVVMTVFQRKLSLFIAVLQLGLISFFAKIQRLLEGKNERVVPMRHYVLLAVFQTTNQSLSYIAMQYVNYTVKVLFKSSRILTTMMFGALYCKRRYPYTDYAAVAFIVVGLIMFINADAKTSSTYDSTGIILLTTSILVDGASLNIQEELMNFYRCRPLEVIFYTNAMSASLMFVLVLCSGELWKGVGFLWKSHNLMNGFLSMVLLSFAGFLNATCVSTITKHFGALVSSISSAIRRALALILSFVLFPKPVVPLHFYGFGILSFGVFIKALPRKEFYNKPEASKVSAR